MILTRAPKKLFIYSFSRIALFTKINAKSVSMTKISTKILTSYRVIFLTAGGSKMSTAFPTLLRQMSALGATDMFLSRGKSATYRINGKLTTTEGDGLTEEDLDLICAGVTSEEQNQRFRDQLELNISYKAAGIGRFRISIFRQMQNTSMVVRAIPSSIPTPEDLGLPPIVTELAAKKRGLILIVGPSGSGKSTSLASLINQRAKETASHIITIEDPIEYIINHGDSVINQREIGIDTHSFHNALESALRQSPDVLCIGEIRSKDTMDHALMFVDSGHFCMATLHANNATQAIERILNFFPENKRDQILLGLSMNLRAIIAQQLVPDIEGNLTAVFELLQASPRISDLIENGDFAGMRESMEKDTSDMLSLDQSLFNLYSKKIISAQTAMEYANSYRDMRLKMRLTNTAPSLV